MLHVGERYLKNIASEGGHYSYHGQHDFVLALRGLKKREIDDVDHAPADFALFRYPPILFLLYRFGSVGWGDCSYSWHLDPVEPPEPLAGEQCVVLPVTLVELPGSIVRAIRAISLSPEFSCGLVEEIRAQAAAPKIDRTAYNAAIDRAYRSYAVDDMVLRALIRCHGGS